MVVGAYRLDVGRREEKELAARHAGRKAEAESGAENGKGKKRWGTREIEIEEVRLKDSSGQERFVFESGEPFDIEMKIRAREMMEDFVFGVGLFNSNGICCYGTNTYLEKFKPRSF